MAVDLDWLTINVVLICATEDRDEIEIQVEAEPSLQ